MSKKSKKKASYKPKPERRLCIFCGNTPLTEEHLWPVWIKEFTPKTSDNSHLQLITDLTYSNADFSNGEMILTPDLRKIPGPPASRKLKVVCSACNNGWMSKIEDMAKEVMTPLILGQSITINKAQQDVLVKWAVLKSIIGEYTDLNHIGITTGERHFFHETKLPPPGWIIFIGRNGASDWQHRYYHTGGFIGVNVFAGAKSSLVKIHYQDSIFTIGQLFIYILKLPRLPQNHTNPNKIIKPYTFADSLFEKIIEIHPDSENIKDWNTLLMITNDELEELKINMSEYIFNLPN